MLITQNIVVQDSQSVEAETQKILEELKKLNKSQLVAHLQGIREEAEDSLAAVTLLKVRLNSKSRSASSDMPVGPYNVSAEQYLKEVQISKYVTDSEWYSLEWRFQLFIKNVNDYEEWINNFRTELYDFIEEMSSAAADMLDPVSQTEIGASLYAASQLLFIYSKIQKWIYTVSTPSATRLLFFLGESIRNKRNVFETHKYADDYYNYLINMNWKDKISLTYLIKRWTNNDIWNKSEQYMNNAKIKYSEAERIKAEQERSEILYGYN
ncbi:hypothetical protein [Mycoplasma hafezii]|uniref:hypothetical protein n=1 Tax=Mycoplasma hafezii TaxID=525886 RepID=UPI003CF094E5